MATIINLAEAVVAELNATTFSQPLTAVRYFQPNFELADMTSLHVSVVPRGLASQALDRQRHRFDYQIDVAIQQKTDLSLAALDDLMTLVEEIADHLRTQPLSSYPGARCTEVKNEPVYSLDHLAEFHQFTSLITLTYAVPR